MEVEYKFRKEDKHMKKKIVCLLLVMLILSTLAGCCLSHEWEDATCMAPKTCSKCEKTEGEPLPHTWDEATCTTPKTCSVCGTTEGEPLPHTWGEATCTTPKTCSVCGTTEGDALPHSLIDATCTTPKTCSVCGATEGYRLAHSWTDATCTSPKTCHACGKTEGETIEHSWEWVVTTDPSYGKEGSRDGVCSVCGTTTTEQMDALIPEYTWNEPIVLEMPLATVEVGMYKNTDEYWIELSCDSMNTDQFLPFFIHSTSEWGFNRRNVAERLQTVMGNYDSIWGEGTYAYCSMEGYGIKWTVYMDMNDDNGCTIGLKVNKENEFRAVCNAIITE